LPIKRIKVLAKKKSAEMKKPSRRHVQTQFQASVLERWKPGQSFLFCVIVDINSVAVLVASLISSIVFVFGKVPLSEMVPVMRTIILAFALPLLISAVFRIILVFTCGARRRSSHCVYRGSNDGRAHQYRQSQYIWFEIHSHKNSSSCLSPPPSLKLVDQDEERTSLIPSVKGRVDSVLLTAEDKTAHTGGNLRHATLPNSRGAMLLLH